MTWGRRKSTTNKYSVSPRAERTVDDRVFHSKKEANRYLYLTSLKQAGFITGLLCQVPFKYEVVYRHGDREFVKTETYNADFTYHIADSGDYVVEDVKGYRTDEYKRKKKIVEKLFDITISEV